MKYIIFNCYFHRIHGEHPSLVYETAVENNIQLTFQDLTFQTFRSNGLVPNEEFQDLINNVLAVGTIIVVDPPEEFKSAGEYRTSQ